MLLNRILAFVLWAALVSPDLSAAESGCKFAKNGMMRFYQEEKLLHFRRDGRGKLYVHVKSGDSFSVQCGSGGGANAVANNNYFQCVFDDVVETRDGRHAHLHEVFSCRRKFESFTETVTRNGTCYNGYTNIVIELSNGVDKYTLATICHNEDTSETLFTKSLIRGADLDESEPIERPSFKEAGFYPDLSAEECYSKDGQLATVALLVGSEDLAAEYIFGETYLSRGHLMPNADGIEGYEKAATFYYVNVVGQWQPINGGNWVKLEENARKIAERRQSNLTIYTGGHGVISLVDINNNPVEIWLGRDSDGNLLQKLPVPHWSWKVIHDEERQDAAAVIQLNNPWITPTSDDIICPDVCDQLSWINWDTTNVQKGYTFCCTVDEFYKAVPFAPNLGDLPLLNEPIKG